MSTQDNALLNTSSNCGNNNSVDTHGQYSNVHICTYIPVVMLGGALQT